MNLQEAVDFVGAHTVEELLIWFPWMTREDAEGFLLGLTKDKINKKEREVTND